MKKIVSIIFIFSVLVAYSNSPKADLYFNKYKSATDKEEKIQSLLEFCSEYRTFPYDTLKKYSNIAVLLSKKKNNSFYLSKSYLYLATYYYRVSKLDSALMILDLGHQINSKGVKDIGLKRKFSLLNSSIFIKKGLHKDALDEYFKLMDDKTIERDTVSYLATLNGIGWANMELQRYDEAKKWFLKVKNCHVSDSIEENKIASLLNLAVTYGALNSLDSAKTIILQNLVLARKYKQLLTEANSLNILAEIYANTNQIPKAIQSVKESMFVRQKIGDPFYIISDMAQLSQLYASDKKYDEGIKIAREALEIADKNNLEAKKAFILSGLYQNYLGKKDYKTASSILIELLSLKDSLNNKASAEKIAEMETKYNLAQKEITIVQQNDEIKNKNLIIWFTLISLFGILLTAYFLYRALKYRQESKIKSLELEQQQKLTQSIFETEENEKNKIGASLHDGLGQLLSVIKMNLQFMQTHVRPLDAKVSEIYFKTLDLVDESINEIRDVSHQLLPSFIISKGLKVALEELCFKFKNPNIKIDVNISELPDSLNSTVKINVYRIIQECLNNIIKHADAKHIFVTLDADDTFLHGLIEDNGIGFDTNSEMKKGIGLHNIKTRVEFLKGELEINSEPDKGTVTAFHIPIN
jgi:signal transduction histidine kinase